MNGKVSVIIPCYNNSRVIGETIDSVICQSYDNWEIICVDDGSDDNTCQIVNDYSLKDPRIRLVRRERTPKGGSVCRNIGIEHSKGDYLLFLDADDILHVDCLRERIGKISGNSLDFVVFPFASMKNGVVGKKSTDASIKKHFFAFSSNHAVWQTSCPLYRKSFVERVGGFDETFPRLQDVEFGIRCLAESSGNYKTYLENQPADCYYRITQNKQDVSKKYDLAFSTIPKLYQLLLTLNNDGKYSKKCYSKIILCLILSAILISSNTSKKQPYTVLFPKDYSKDLLFLDKSLLFFLGLIRPLGSFYYKVTHVIRYSIIHLFFA